jgi:predicted nucleic acid-binding protein
VKLVLDASVVVKWFVREDGHETAHHLFAIDVAWSAPSLLPVEVANTLWKKVRRGEFAAEAATEAVGRLAHLPIRHVDTADLVAAAFALARRLDHPVYDCCYLAVAEAEDGRVVTADRRLLARVHATSLAARVVALDAFVAAQG